MSKAPRNDYVTTAEAAETLQVTQRYVQMLIKDGFLPSFQPGRRMLLIPRPAFEEYLRTRHRKVYKAPKPPKAVAPPPTPSPPVEPPQAAPVAGRLVVDLMELERQSQRSQELRKY